MASSTRVMLLTVLVIVALMSTTTVSARRLHGRMSSKLKVLQSESSFSEVSAASRVAAASPPVLATTEAQAQAAFQPQGVLYHATSGIVGNDFLDRPVWFSPNQLDGWRMYAQKMANPPMNMQTMVRAAPAAKVDVHTCTPTRALRLFHMAKVEATSYNTLRAAPWNMADNVFPAVAGGKRWYSKQAGHGSAFVAAFCAAAAQQNPVVDGWRNAWDQNEVMLCHPQGLIRCNGGSTCLLGQAPNPHAQPAVAGTGVLGQVGATGPYRISTMHDDQAHSDRFTFTVLPRDNVYVTDDTIANVFDRTTNAEAPHALAAFQGACAVNNALVIGAPVVVAAAAAPAAVAVVPAAAPAAAPAAVHVAPAAHVAVQAQPAARTGCIGKGCAVM